MHRPPERADGADADDADADASDAERPRRDSIYETINAAVRDREKQFGTLGASLALPAVSLIFCFHHLWHLKPSKTR